MESKYMVVKVGQLREHDSHEEAEKEAHRLGKQYKQAFYVVQTKGVAIPHGEIKFKHVKELMKLLSKPQSRKGEYWPEMHDDLLIYMWMEGVPIERLMEVFGRSELGIICRLEKWGFQIW